MINKIYSILGICMKAGKLVCGSDVCIENIKKRKAKLVIVSEDASQNTKDKIANITKQNNITLIYFGEKEFLSKSVGKVDKAIYAILDDGFSKKILELLTESKGAI